MQRELVMKDLFMQIILATAFSFLVACAPAKLEEIQRSTCANGGIDAVVATKETDATVGTPTEVYVVPEKEGPAGDPVLRVDKAKGLRVIWGENDNLVVYADSARVFLYTPELTVRAHDGSIHVVSVRLDIKNKS